MASVLSKEGGMEVVEQVVVVVMMVMMVVVLADGLTRAKLARKWPSELELGGCVITVFPGVIVASRRSGMVPRLRACKVGEVFS